MKTNKAVTRAMDIINLIALSSRPLTITEVSESLRIPKTSTFEILYTLVEERVLDIADEHIRSFQLGLRLFEISLSALSSTNLLEAARPILHDLNKKTGETVLFAVEDNNEMVFLYKVDGSAFLLVSVKLGTRVPMHCTAIGKAVLAALSEEKIRLYLKKSKIKKITENTLTNFRDLKKDLEETRERGFSIDHQENIDDVVCVGAPIYSYLGSVVAGMSITTQSSKTDEETVLRLGELVRESAIKISKRLGYGKNTTY